MILALRFHTTPWGWRGETRPDDADWATAVHLLNKQAEELET